MKKRSRVKKLKKINLFLRSIIKERFKKDDWQYIDFVLGNRVAEILDDKEVNFRSDHPFDLARYIFDKIR